MKTVWLDTEIRSDIDAALVLVYLLAGLPLSCASRIAGAAIQGFGAEISDTLGMSPGTMG